MSGPLRGRHRGRAGRRNDTGPGYKPEEYGDRAYDPTFGDQTYRDDRPNSYDLPYRDGLSHRDDRSYSSSRGHRETWDQGRRTDSHSPTVQQEMARPDPKTDPDRFWPPQGNYVDQIDLPIGFGTTVCITCLGPCHGKCLRDCARCGRPHVNETCPKLWLSYHFYKDKLRMIPWASETHIKLRPSENDVKVLVDAGHTWAAGIPSAHAVRTRHKDYLKRTIEEAQLAQDSGHTAKFSRSELDMIREDFDGKLRQMSQDHQQQIVALNAAMEAQQEELEGLKSTIKAQEKALASLMARVDEINTAPGHTEESKADSEMEDMKDKEAEVLRDTHHRFGGGVAVTSVVDKN